jgi:ATP-dependent phosphofructokinase / diphosphate-dependent phosphofructokinase
MSSTPKNLFFAHSGGVTAVVNTIAASVIQAAQQNNTFGSIYIGKHGILGALNEDWIDAQSLNAETQRQIAQSPGSFAGSCRHKLKDPKERARLIAIFKKHNIGYFLYNGGNDSQDTTHKVALLAKEQGLDLQCIGLPKTIDNDLPHTDFCPGFPSAAKYVALSTLEASIDLASMAKTSTKVFILEVMGRHAGWIAAASALAQDRLPQVPHIILMPEAAFDPARFLKHVDACVQEHGFCTVVASEGARDASGRFLSEQGGQDAFGHVQLGGVAAYLANLIKKESQHKTHYAIADYLQRSARHIASQVDVDCAWQLGQEAIQRLTQGESGCMLTLTRQNNTSWQVSSTPLDSVANQEYTLPADFIRKDGMGVTPKALDYFRPLIQGEAYPTYHNGLPEYYCAATSSDKTGSEETSKG